jgi:hypothetical protein
MDHGIEALLRHMYMLFTASRNSLILIFSGGARMAASDGTSSPLICHSHNTHSYMYKTSKQTSEVTVIKALRSTLALLPAGALTIP